MTDDIPTVPADCQAQFIGEGAANVVFALTTNQGQPAFPGYLLRVPKAGTSAFSYRDLQTYWKSTVSLLFGEDGRQLVKQSLVSLQGSGIVPRLNALLETIEHTRRADFRGSRVAADGAEQGMLVEDMRPRDGGEYVIEFKPKWLAQSPAAPRTAMRCRNCAREAYRAVKDGKVLGSDAGRGLPPLCPLKLVCGRGLKCKDEACGEGNDKDSDCEVGAVATTLLSGADGRADEGVLVKYKGPLTRWIRENELFPRLRKLQVACDTGLEGDQELNMTLRDCTCFVRLSPGRPVEARLGDLDRKNGAAKRQYWAKMERKLAEGGYYEGKEVPRQRTACWLERGRETQERDGAP